jgi:hypothetical protein
MEWFLKSSHVSVSAVRLIMQMRLNLLSLKAAQCGFNLQGREKCHSLMNKEVY